MAKAPSKPATQAGTASSHAASNPAGSSDPHAGPSQDGRRPVHTIRYRTIKAAIWENDSGNGPFFSVTISRSWQDERKDWHDSQSFNAADLPTLAKAVNDAHTWIAWIQRQRQQPAQS